MTLTEFLTARIAEDEATGLARSENATQRYRVLREVEAKRRILEDCVEFDLTGVAVLRALAAVYADHPDYDEAWAL